jgi:hypothetical protein
VQKVYLYEGVGMKKLVLGLLLTFGSAYGAEIECRESTSKQWDTLRACRLDSLHAVADENMLGCCDNIPKSSFEYKMGEEVLKNWFLPSGGINWCCLSKAMPKGS